MSGSRLTVSSARFGPQSDEQRRAKASAGHGQSTPGHFSDASVRNQSSEPPAPCASAYICVGRTICAQCRSMVIDPLKGLPGYALRRVSAAFMAELASRLAVLDLRPAEATVLLVIGVNPGITQSDV